MNRARTGLAGVGFRPPGDPGRPGLGVRERVGPVGGALLSESGYGEGTTVLARIPLVQDESNRPA